MSVSFAPVVQLPDLIFGLVGPIGVDLNYITQSISDSVASFNYTTYPISITDIMQELVTDVIIDESEVSNSYKTKIEYANELRRRYDSNDILAALAISAIQKQ